jgi:hypothetical protein
MTIPVTRASTSIAAVLVSVVCLIVLVFMLAGPEYFLGLLVGSVLHIAVISAVAGVVRLPFRRGGFVLSVVCGASIALAGFLIVLAHAVSRI